MNTQEVQPGSTPSCTLYVGHLPVGTNVESVRDLCTPFGAVGDIRIKLEKVSRVSQTPVVVSATAEPAAAESSPPTQAPDAGQDIATTPPISADITNTASPPAAADLSPARSAGGSLAFVTFMELEGATAALAGLDGSLVDGCCLKVNYAHQTAGPRRSNGSGATGNGNARWGSRDHKSGAREDTSRHHQIFVGDLGPEVTDAVLYAAFSGVTRGCSGARVMWDVVTGRTKAYGFASFRSREDAQSAIDAMQGQVVGSRQIRCGWAQHKQEELVTAPDVEEIDRLDPENRNVYVANVPLEWEEAEVSQHFEGYGKIEEVKVHRKGGYCFVRFKEHSQAVAAIVGASAQQVEGKLLKVSWGRPANHAGNDHHHQHHAGQYQGIPTGGMGYGRGGGGMNTGAIRGGRGGMRGGGGGRGSGYASNNPSQSNGSEYGYAMGSVFNNQQNPMSYLTLMAGGRGGGAANNIGQGGPYSGVRANSQTPIGLPEGGLYHGGGVQGAGRSGSGDYASGKDEGAVDGGAGSYNGSVAGSARLGMGSPHGGGAVERRASNNSQMGAGGGRGGGGNAIAQLQQMQRSMYYQGNNNPMMMMAGLHSTQAGGNGNMAAPLQHWQQQQQVSAYNRSGQSTQQQQVNAMVQMGYPVGNNASQAASSPQQQAQTPNPAMTQQQPMYYAASPMQYYNR